MTNAVQVRITATEFARLPETNMPTELIYGEVIVTPAPSNTHQTLVYRLAKLIENCSPEGGEVRIAPLDVYLDEFNVVQPDVFWISGAESHCRLGEDDYWHGAPDLVVEVLSPATTLRDRREKFALYEKHGVREYWIVDPIGRYIEVYVARDGKLERQGLYGPDESFEALMLGGKQVDLKVVFGE